VAETLRITITGLEAARAALEARPGAIRQALSKAMQKALNTVFKRVQENLTGRVLNVRSGRLRQSFLPPVADGMRGVIGSNLEYAAIHEFGGVTRPHVIEAKAGSALAFVHSRFIGPVRRTQKGKFFKGDTSGISVVKKVNHPGSVMPARPYLRPALRDSIPEINEIFRAGLAAELGK
jgi:phage gpG-like protein